MTELAGGEALVAASTAFAVTITKVVDFIRTAFDRDDNPRLKPLWAGLALVLGMVGAVVFEINIFGEISNSRGDSVFGMLLTGAGMGAAGSAWHEVLDAASSSAKRSKPRTAAAKR